MLDVQSRRTEGSIGCAMVIARSFRRGSQLDVDGDDGGCQNAKLNWRDDQIRVGLGGRKMRVCERSRGKKQARTCVLHLGTLQSSRRKLISL